MRHGGISARFFGKCAGVSRGRPPPPPFRSDPPGGASRPTRSSAPDDATRQSRAARSALGERLESKCAGSDAPCPCPCARRGRGAGVVREWSVAGSATARCAARRPRRRRARPARRPRARRLRRAPWRGPRSWARTGRSRRRRAGARGTRGPRRRGCARRAGSVLRCRGACGAWASGTRPRCGRGRPRPWGGSGIRVDNFTIRDAIGVSMWERSRRWLYSGATPTLPAWEQLHRLFGNPICDRRIRCGDFGRDN